MQYKLIRRENMRTYRFKGRSIKTNEWVCGNLVQTKGGLGRPAVYILEFPVFIPVMTMPTDDFHEVDPDTVTCEIL